MTLKSAVSGQLAILAILASLLCSAASGQPILNLSTLYASAQLDDRGFIASLTSRQSGKQYCPTGHPSPLMSLHEYGQPYSQLILPTSATYYPQGQKIALKYPNGAVAIVKPEAKPAYLRFQLISLAPRGNVDNIVWGPLHTTMSKKIGDIIGVVRDDDWAIGMLGLDDNTMSGPPCDCDMYKGGYYIHSSDPVHNPVPSQYHEGEQFAVGGNGVNDVAFYSHSEEYFHMYFGTGAYVEPDFAGSSIVYHSRDRRRSYTYLISPLISAEQAQFRPRHQVGDPLPGVDFMGSAVALYACPDNLGLATIESVILAEGLPHPTFEGKWIRDPSGFQPDLFWDGPVDKEIEYARALGLKHLSRETGEFYPNIDRVNGTVWHGNVGFADGHQMSYKDFAALAAQSGMGHGGLHTLSMFLQGGIAGDVGPIPNPHLLTLCRTTLAKDVSPTDKEITVTDPSFFGEHGTPPAGDYTDWMRIGEELTTYDCKSVGATAPCTIKVGRDESSHKSADLLTHKAGDEVVKLDINGYHGFAPDMTLLMDYADYYAKLMAENGMESIGFDGLESTVYQAQGYYSVRRFFRRLFDTYSKLTGHYYLRVLPSCIFPGAWEFVDACNCGSGDHMFNAAGNSWGIEGKDMRDAFSASYFPPTFGLQGFHSEWSLYDAENLEAKSVGWDATYSFVVSQAALDQSGEREGVFKAFHAWEAARATGAFTAMQKNELQDLHSKFHLEQTGDKSFVLYPIKEVRIDGSAGKDEKPLTITNAEATQPLQFALQVGAPVTGCAITLPDGARIESSDKMEAGQFIICKGNRAYVADKFRKKTAELPMTFTATLNMGDSKVGVQFPGATGNVPFNATVWISGKGERVGI